MLAIERDTQCNLPLKIIERQREVLEGSLELLRNRKWALDEGIPLREEGRGLTNIQDLMSKLFRDARQIAEDHKRIIEQENVPCKSSIPYSEWVLLLSPEWDITLFKLTLPIGSNFGLIMNIW